jgi:hypothetical protein
MISTLAMAQSVPLDTILGSYHCSTANKTPPVLMFLSCLRRQISAQRPFVQDGHDIIAHHRKRPATVKNASGKQIVAVAINVEARCGLLGTQMVYTHDMMFKPSGFVPDELISLAVADLDMGMSGDVQFADQHGHNRGGSLHRSDT